MTDEERVADLLLTWEEARERGNAITAEELCRGCPELLDAVRDRIRLLEKTAWMSGPAKPPQQPRTLAERYVLEALIGSGGYADVWRAYDLRLHRHVAVKVPRPSRTLTALQIDEVLTEARQVARLKHVNIVTLHDVLKEGAGYVLVSDLIDGETLADRLRRGPMPPNETVKLLATVARAIDYAHGQGVVHRDLKPANILLDRAGTPHVGDFGLARPKTEFLEGSDQRGTLAYSSPEQLEGKPLDGRTDIWSLGIIMYEMLTGRPAFSDDNPVKLKQIILAAKMPDARDVPAALTAICRRCLAVKPDERYARGGDLADALETATATKRSRWWLLPTALVASSLVGLAIYLSRPNEPKAKAEPDAPVAEKNGEVIPPKIEPKIDPGTEPIKEKPPARPPARTLEGHTSAVRTVQVRAGGWIASTDEKTLRLWSPTGAAAVVDLPSPPTAEVFGHGGYSLFTGHEDGKLRQWWVGARTDAERAAGWASWSTLPTNARLVSSPVVVDRPRPFTIRSWDGDGTPVQAVTVSPTGRWVAWTTDKRLFVWDLVTNRAVAPLDKPDRPTVALFFVPDPPFKPDELLFVGYGTGPDRRSELSLWKVMPFKGELGLSPRGKMNNFGMMPGVQHVTADSEFGLIVTTLEAGIVAFGQGDKAMSFNILAQLGHAKPGSRRTVILPGGKRTLSYGAEGHLCIWEPQTQRQTIISDPHPEPVTDAAVSADGVFAVTGCRDGKLRVWAIPNEKK